MCETPEDVNLCNDVSRYPSVEKSNFLFNPLTYHEETKEHCSKSMMTLFIDFVFWTDIKEYATFILLHWCGKFGNNDKWY